MQTALARSRSTAPRPTCGARTPSGSCPRSRAWGRASRASPPRPPSGTQARAAAAAAAGRWTSGRTWITPSGRPAPAARRASPSARSRLPRRTACVTCSPSRTSLQASSPRAPRHPGTRPRPRTRWRWRKAPSSLATSATDRAPRAQTRPRPRARTPSWPQRARASSPSLLPCAWASYAPPQRSRAPLGAATRPPRRPLPAFCRGRPKPPPPRPRGAEASTWPWTCTSAPRARRAWPRGRHTRLSGSAA
mmetsp:Transcript_3166/g.9108  ORF Transcript_3166/g.9108 Transcript_3166/m.9108 type:complete len:249 (+) Transcript_3166:176-922(+)